jgi:hypothetical protein
MMLSTKHNPTVKPQGNFTAQTITTGWQSVDISPLSLVNHITARMPFAVAQFQDGYRKSINPIDKGTGNRVKSSCEADLLLGILTPFEKCTLSLKARNALTHRADRRGAPSRYNLANSQLDYITREAPENTPDGKMRGTRAMMLSTKHNPTVKPQGNFTAQTITIDWQSVNMSLLFLADHITAGRLPKSL